MSQQSLFVQSAPTPPQRWWCPLCGFRYESPLPLQHPPNHNCHPHGGPMRNRKMQLEATP